MCTGRGNSPGVIGRRGRGYGSGFTLVEILVMLGVIVVMISLLLPALAMVRDRGRVAVSLSGQRQVLVAVSVFGLSRNGSHPYVYRKRVGSYSEPFYEVSETAGDGFTALKMAGQARMWGSVVVDSGTGVRDVLYQPRWSLIREQDEETGMITGSFVASSTMFAHPKFFGTDASLASPSHFGRTRSSQIAFPSSKMLFEDLESWYLLPQFEDVRTATYGFGDGSAAVMRTDEFSGDWVDRSSAWDVSPGHTTLDGLAGRDR